MIDIKAENRGRGQIQLSQWGVSTTKSRVGFTQVFELHNLLLAENASYEITESIDDDIAKALARGAELFCETALGDTIIAPLKVQPFPS